ncbi:hypothetical protein Syun_020845 [Stephania yunnanensis]|uniref:Uncharacterized protein n=1 Tax=Stephania yunnanensis TaxID=152371 RepID=A0AAP0IFE2_9MAGN
MVTCDSSISDLCPRTVVITLYLLIASRLSISISAWHTISSSSCTPTSACFHSILVTPLHIITSSNVYPHDHGIRPSSSHHATPSPSGHPAHSLGVDDEHTSTSRRALAPHRHSSMRSSSSRLRSSIPQAIEEIPDFFRPPTALAEDEAFKKKSEQMSSNRKSEVGVPGTGISLHSARSISARQHGDTLDELIRRLEEMSTQTPEISIDEDVVYLEVVPEVKGRVYGLRSQVYHRNISSGGASSSRGPAYELHELEKL